MPDTGWPRPAVRKGLFVVIGVAYVAAGPTVFGFGPWFVGGALVAYGVVGYLGGRVVYRWLESRS